MRKLITHIVILLLFSLNALAQRSIDHFGKNRVQYDEFDWKYITSRHFYIYYYLDGERLAHNAARHLEREFENITNTLGVEPYDRIEIIVYNSVSDFQQSNVGLRSKDFIGGETNIVKARIEVPFNGSMPQFKNDLDDNVSRKIIEMMLYGGSLKETIRASYTLHLPEWFISGAAAYIGNGDTPEMRAAVYDALKNGEDDPLKLRDENARLIGQSIWYMIAQKYGEYALSNIVNMAGITMSDEQALMNITGLNYNRLSSEWSRFYGEMFFDSLSTKETLHKQQRLLRFNSKRRDFNNFEYSPNGKYLAYSLNKEGKYKVRVIDLETGKKKTVLRGGIRITDQKLNERTPILAWRNTDELSMIVYKKGQPFMITKGIGKHYKEKKSFVAYEEILDADYQMGSPYMVLSGVKKGHSDIHLYDYVRDRAYQITEDMYDDLNPHFIPGTSKVVFSSNRINDTLGVDFGEAETILNNYDLFAFDSEKPKMPVLERITKSEVNEMKPEPISKTKILVMTDRDKHYDISMVDLETEEVVQKSDFGQLVEDYDYNPQRKSLTVRQKDQLRYHLYSVENYSLDSNYYSYPAITEEFVPEDTLTTLDKLVMLDLDKLRFTSDTITKRDYKQWALSQEQALANLDEERKLKTYGPYEYGQPILSTDYVVTSLVLDPLRGAGILLEAGMTEFFFDHKFNASIHVQSELRSSNFYLEYEYLKKRNDFRVRYKNENIFSNRAQGDATAYNANHLEFEFSHPISPVLRFSLVPLIAQTRYTDYLNTQEPQQKSWLGGVRAEIVLDNTKELGLNLLDGTRFKASFTPYSGLTESTQSFSKINLDLRKYVSVFKKIVIAGRAGYGRFLGTSKKSFLLGGTDNWLFANTDNVTNSDSPLNVGTQTDKNNILFVDYVTNVRGFNYNHMYGEQYLIFNAEIRFPIAQMLTRRPISSNFARNFQLITFYDAGSAWTGSSPFSEDNNINTQPFGAPTNDFQGTVTNYLNPFIQSYGFGLRSTLFGYYMKLDFAWPIEHYNRNPMKVHFTLGYDF